MGGGGGDRGSLAGRRLRGGAGGRRLRGHRGGAQRAGARGAGRGGPPDGGDGHAEKRQTGPEGSHRGRGQRTTNHTPAIITTIPTARAASTGRTVAPNNPKSPITAPITH